jgi:hypothetical protein
VVSASAGSSTALNPTIGGIPGDTVGETLGGGAGRRGREDDEDGRSAARRRSTSLDDADPLPRAGRRAAPETDDRADSESRTSKIDDPGASRADGRRAESDAAADSTDPGKRAKGDGHATRTTDSKSETPMRPGDVVETQIAFWDDEAVTHFRSQWHEVKADFVDDPVAALTRAHDLLTEAVNELTESLLAERDELDPLQTTSTPDTESMRMAMRGYREFLDRILAL